jgi:hypothetical protein
MMGRLLIIQKMLNIQTNKRIITAEDAMQHTMHGAEPVLH